MEKGTQAMETLVSKNLRLVKHIASKYTAQNKNLCMEDLMQAGIEGLKIAIGRFDASKGLKLSTSAYWWIRQRVQRFSKRDNLIK
jgi:RNA polymerase primary sigma factor